LGALRACVAGITLLALRAWITLLALWALVTWIPLGAYLALRSLVTWVPLRAFGTHRTDGEIVLVILTLTVPSGNRKKIISWLTAQAGWRCNDNLSCCRSPTDRECTELTQRDGQWTRAKIKVLSSYYDFWGAAVYKDFGNIQVSPRRLCH
jgi:hypothetical protein